jgi:hypothetical protein
MTLVSRMNTLGRTDLYPRDITVELTTRRMTKAIFQLATHIAIGRGDMEVAVAESLFKQAASCDDIRVTLSGAGDPLLHPNVLEIVASAKSRGIKALHLETDLLCGDMSALVDSALDVVSVHLPATTAQTYQKLMGVNAMAKVLENIAQFLQLRASKRKFTPILCPIFTKTRENIGEMEAWYDFWIKATGCAVITGPSTSCGRIADLSATQIAPPGRVPCRRIDTRLTVLSTGQFCPCEEDALGEMAFNTTVLDEAWRVEMEKFRGNHQAGLYPSLCASCDQWHRP